MTNPNNTPVARPIEFSAPPESQDSGWAILGFIWRRLWLIVLAVILGLGAGYLKFLQEPAVFQSSAQLLIVGQRALVPIPEQPAQARYESLHASYLRSPVIINQAIKNHDLDSLPSLRSSGDLVGRIIGGLSVSATPESSGDIVRFTYASDSPEECPKVLDAVIDAYRVFLGETYQNVNQETVDLITQAKDVLDRQIMEIQQEYQKFRDQAPLLYLGGEGKNVHEARLQQIESMRSDLQVENWQTQAKIDAIEAAIKRGGPREALNLMIGQIREAGEAAGPSAPGSRRSIEEQVFPMLMEEQILLDSFGRDHPKVTALRRRIELTREHLLGKLPAGGDDETKPRDFHQVYLESLREQIRMNEEQVASMSRLFDQESDAARSIDKYQVQDANYRAEIARKERMFDAVVARLEEISVSMELGNIKTQLIHPPGRGYQIAPDMKKSLATAGILGLLAGLGLAFVVDSLDRRFRNPDDIRTQLGLPVVGHIPVIPVSNDGRRKREKQPDAEPNLDPALRVFHHPRGRIAEAYRAVRTALYFNTRGGGNKIIQVTSPNPGDGKTTLASNLAVSIADSGKRTLLVDADFRRPRVHKMFGIVDSVGLSEVMSGSVELADAIIETEIPNLSVLVCGKRPANPAELLTSSQFQQLIEVLREKYEFVIFDTPPVLAVTDPLAVAPRVDGVLLVMRLAKSARNVSQKTIEALDSLGATVLGIVVNGVGSGSRYGGYGYSSYGYRYGGYSHHYGGYGDAEDGYGDKDTPAEKTYVTEDDGSLRASVRR